MQAAGPMMMYSAMMRGMSRDHRGSATLRTFLVTAVQPTSHTPGELCWTTYCGCEICLTSGAHQLKSNWPAFVTPATAPMGSR